MVFSSAVVVQCVLVAVSDCCDNHHFSENNERQTMQFLCVHSQSGSMKAFQHNALFHGQALAYMYSACSQNVNVLWRPV